jgi:hypothetical protein
MASRATWVAAALALAVAGTADANIIFTPGNNPQPNEDNILFEDPGTIDGPATTITGHVNQSVPSQFVSFTSDENLQPTAGGQADVEAVDGDFQNLTIALMGGTFGDFILNPAIFGQGNSVNGNMVVTVSQVSGPDAVYDFNVGSAGNNFLTIVAQDGQRMTSINLSTTVSGLQITRLAQPRISTPTQCPSGSTDPLCGPLQQTPEPGTLGLIGLGLAGLAALRRRKQR